MDRTKQLAYILIDQGFSSALSLVLPITVARLSSVSDFGLFSTFFVLFLMTQGAWRASGIEPVLALYSADNINHSPQHFFKIFVVCITASLPFIIVAFAIAFFTDFLTFSLLAQFILVVPVAISIDCLRTLHIASSNPPGAAKITMCWFCIFILLFTILSYLKLYDVNNAVEVFALSGLIAFLVNLRLSHNNGDSIVSLKQIRPVAQPLWLDYIFGASVIQSISFIVVLFAGLNEAAGFRGALVFCGVLTTFLTGLRIGLIRDARVNLIHSHSLASYFVKTSLVLFVIGGVIALCTMIAFNKIGTAMLGETWIFASSSIFPLLCAFTVSSIQISAATILKVTQRTKALLKISLCTFPIFITFSLIGALIDGSKGAAIGFLLAITIKSFFTTFYALKQPSK